ncbi:hypothetical protein VQ01_07505 [Tamlana sp. s12]|nr:hypothetical protein VQ01_07505 [Tamlana sp. s12]
MFFEFQSFKVSKFQSFEASEFQRLKEMFGLFILVSLQLCGFVTLQLFLNSTLILFLFLLFNVYIML